MQNQKIFVTKSFVMRNTLLSFLLCLGFFSSYAQGFQQTAGLATTGPCEAIFVDGDLILTSVARKLFRSTDGGTSFEYISMGQYDVTPRTFSKVGNVIIMGSIDGERIYRSLDDGATWEIANDGGPTISGFPSAVPITSDVLNGDVFMCGTNFIRKSSDQGLTWQTMTIDGLCYDISETAGNVWATPGGNLHKSTDGGVTWVDVPDDGLFFSNSSVDVLENQGRIFVCTSLSAGNGLYHSDDGGQTYVLNNGGFSISNKIELFDGKLYTTHLGGLSISEDNGDSWTTVASLDGLAGYSGDMAFDGDETIWISSGNGLYSYNINTEETGSVVLPVGSVQDVSMGTNAFYGIQNGKVFQSLNSGNTWNDITNVVSSAGFEATDVYADGNEVYISGSQNFSPVFFSSTDGGTSFNQLTLPSEISEVLQVLSYNPVILATDAGAYVSMDNGQNFSLADLKAPDGSDIPDSEGFTTISHNNSSIYLSGTTGGAYSHDNGTTWTFISMTGLVKLSGWEDRLIRHVSTAWPPFKTEESTDGGLTWNDVTGYVQQFAGPSFMWMANNTLYLQNDQGNTNPGEFNKLTESASEWELDPAMGSLNDQVISISHNENGEMLLGTFNSGAWVSSGLSNSIQEREKEQIPISLYPNPSSDIVYLDFNSEVDLNSIQIQVYDTYGRLAKTVAANTGFVDISSLASGYYIVVLESKNHFKSFKLIKE